MAQQSRTGAQRRTGWAGLAGWVLFDWAAQPFYTLVLTFLFAPYFAAGFIPDPVRGQALWAYLVAASGLLVALSGPVLGAIADAAGPRKPWLAVFSAGLVVGLAGLWLAAPHSGLLLPVCLSFLLAALCAECATIFTNAMLPALVPPERIGRLSGVGWAVGYAGGLASLVLFAGLLVPAGETGRTLLGLAPLLQLDQSAREAERLVGPFSALWYLIFVIPLFLFTPDRAERRAPPGAAVRTGLRQLAETFRQAGRYAGLIRFLIARMLYADGLGAMFAFGGLYAASVFGWGAAQLGLFGILLTLAGAAGALIGGWMDDRHGARAVILFSLAGLGAAALGIVSVDREHVLFFLPVSPAGPDAAPLASAGEQVYLAFALIIGLLAGPLQAASRSYLARRAPAHMMTEFFGLFAFSGKITAFAAPLLVGLVTDLTGSQRSGVAVILAFLAGGLALMALPERQGGR
ncbi:MAG: MFS transporter [Methyloligellaceae bacterium]